ncbi:MAG: hypothetical protein O3B31_16075, partial [Chloroflexi bacterium]|nr:hypothetical protein [Chloroflexota bacterium]
MQQSHDSPRGNRAPQEPARDPMGPGTLFDYLQAARLAERRATVDAADAAGTAGRHKPARARAEDEPLDLSAESPPPSSTSEFDAPLSARAGLPSASGSGGAGGEDGGDDDRGRDRRVTRRLDEDETSPPEVRARPAAADGALDRALNGAAAS